MKHTLPGINIVVAVCGLFVFCASPAVAERRVLDPASPAAPSLEVVSQSAAEVILEYRCGALELDSVFYDARYWTTVRAAGGGLTSEPGRPELPRITRWLQVPWSQPQIEVLESEREVRQWGTVLPAPEIMYRTGIDSLRRTADARIYERNRLYPAALASVDVAGEIARSGAALIAVTPVQVNTRTGEWRIHTYLRIRVTGSRRGALDDIGATPNALLSALTRRPAAPALDEVDAEPRLLIVTESQFVSALEPLIEWKIRCGVPVRTIIFSETASNADALRNHLIGQIESCTVTPEFLLLVGDVDIVPAFYGVGNSLTDHLYSTIIGDDFLPDIAVGRIPCATASELSEWVTRALNYERDGILPPSINSTVFSSSVALDPLHGTHISSMFGSAGLAVSHFQQPQTGTLPPLINSLNQNPAWVFYIGHGHAQAWSSVSPPLQNVNISSLENSASSIVVSVACATADLDYPGASIAEEWFSHSMQGGLLAYFGATESTAFFYSDTIGIAALQAVFEEGIDRLGTAADYGRMMCAQSFPNNSTQLTEETIQQFVLLGDPSLRVYAQTPSPLLANYSSSLPVGSVSLPITISRDGVPLSGAEVCLSGDDVYSRAVTSSSGGAVLSIDLDSPALLHVTATARNSIPYLGDVQLVPNNAPYVVVESVAVADGGGDGDGLADRGESCELHFTLANIGALASSAGVLSISCADVSVSLLGGALAVPAIAAGGERTLEEGISALISAAAVDGETVMLSFEFAGGSEPVSTTLLPLELHAPSIEYMHSELTELEGDDDGNPEGGEVLALDLRFANRGTDRALPLNIDLNTSPNYLQIHDTRVVTDTIESGAEFTARFLFDALPTTPRGYPFEYNFEFAGSNVPPETGWDAQRIGQVPVLLYALDQAPDQVDAMEDGMNALGIEYERTASLPLNLFRYRSIWIFCGVSPNARALPQQEASRLSEYLEGGGNCYWEGADVWSFDANNDLHPYFHIIGDADGTSNAGPVAGEFGTSYQDYYFEYSGENSFIDQLEADGGAMVLLRNQRGNHTYPVCISYAGATYRTIGASIEIGSLDDGDYPSTRVRLLADMLDWFGIETRVDVYPPEILHTPRASFYQRNVPIPIVADIQDASGVATALLHYRAGQAPEETAVMNLIDGLYRAAIPGAPYGTTIHYSISATDQATPVNSVETDEYGFTVTTNPYVPIDLSIVSTQYRFIAPRVEVPEGATCSLIPGAGRGSILELHGAGDAQPVSYTTEIMDCSLLENARVRFWNYLRSGAEDHGVVARVLGSNDGGRTFPYVVWHRVQGAAPVLEEGIIESGVLEWMRGQPRVALRFETTTEWYWRIAEMQVYGDALPQLAPVQNLTVKPDRRGMILNWNETEHAQHYRVFASATGMPGTFELLTDVASKTYVDEESLLMDARFYTVSAVLQAGRRFERTMPVAMTEEASLGAPDLRWNVRMNRQQRE